MTRSILITACATTFAATAYGQRCDVYRFELLKLKRNFVAYLSSPTELRVKVSECSGTPLTAGSVVADFSNRDRQVILRHIGGGVWSGEWTPLHPLRSEAV